MHYYAAEKRVVRLKKVYVPRGHHRLAHLVAQGYYPAVEIAKPFLRVHCAVSHKEGVVAYGLYLEIVVHVRYGHELFLALPPEHRPEQLSCLAGGAYYKALAVHIEKASGYLRYLAQVLEVSI